MIIKSYVGGHDIAVYADCVFDPKTRKYQGGYKIGIIPFCGKVLSAKVEQKPEEPIKYEGIEIPISSMQIFTDVDEIPSEEECDYCIVSSMYVAACKALGKDTSRLLTISGTVVDENGQIIGTTGFNRN